MSHYLDGFIKISNYYFYNNFLCLMCIIHFKIKSMDKALFEFWTINLISSNKFVCVFGKKITKEGWSPFGRGWPISFFYMEMTRGIRWSVYLLFYLGLKAFYLIAFFGFWDVFCLWGCIYYWVKIIYVAFHQ